MSSIFISHSSASAAEAARIEQAFKTAGFDAWLDNSDLGIGVQLRPELHDAIRNSLAVVLVWSEPASRSRWVCAEILVAFHLNRYIVPCVTDDTPLPEFLGRPVYLDLRKATDEALGRLVRSAEAAPPSANPVAPRVSAPSPELIRERDRLARLVRSAEAAPPSANPVAPRVSAPSPELIRERDRLAQLQMRVTGALGERDLAGAARAQRAIDSRMAKAERRWPSDLTILALGGYHRKNAYMVAHWDVIQAGRPPRDPILLDAERRFFEAALVDPNDLSAINGLASILVFELELDAAAFFNDRAIELSKQAGVAYDDAEQDRALIAWMRQQAAHGL